MSKILSVKTTVFPNGQKIFWENGMPNVKINFLDTIMFNRWSKYIRKEDNKTKGWHLNTIKKGGLNHAEAQEEILEMYKLILKQ